MICDLCKKNNAVIHIEKQAGDNRSQMRICCDCAGLDGMSPENLSSESINKLISELAIGLPADSQQEQKVCTQCECSLEELQRTDKAGCSTCYDELINAVVMPKWQKPPYFKHIGKTPYTLKSLDEDRVFHETPNQIQLLKEKLNASISQEDYEEAARLRDEIELLNQK